MRLLHTGDWHVGKTLRGRSRSDEHVAVLEEIATLAAEREVDAVLVAGDVFDTAAPTPEAEQVVYAALLALSQRVQHVVVIAGNHDNARRLAAVQPLLALTNVHVLPTLARPDRGGVLTLETREGPLRVGRLPFLSQRGIVRAADLMAQDAAEHAGQYAERYAAIVQALCAAMDDDGVNVLLAHAMVHGGLLGGGERSAHTIFDYSVPTTAFPGALHYVALGHLHRAQRLEAACPVWYCGSPLQLDFGETEDIKSVNIVDAAPGRPARVESVPLTSGRRLRTLRGTPDAILAQAGDARDDFLRVIVDAPPAPGLADSIRDQVPDAVDVRIAAPQAAGASAGETPASRAGKSPQALFAEYLAQRGEANEAVQSLFAELLEDVDAPDPA